MSEIPDSLRQWVHEERDLEQLVPALAEVRNLDQDFFLQIWSNIVKFDNYKI